MDPRKRILIIDDDPDYVDGMKAILEKADYEVEAAHNPKDGFKALESKPYDGARSRRCDGGSQDQQRP